MTEQERKDTLKTRTRNPKILAQNKFGKWREYENLEHYLKEVF